MQEGSRPAAAAVFGIVALAVAAPPLIALAADGTLGAFRTLAADAFYYLAVADHSQGAPFHTFDGVHPTNGFHPLWQWLLGAGFAALGPDAAGQVRLSVIASTAATAIGLGLYAAALALRTGRPALALVAAVPGFFYPLVAAMNPHVGAPWSFANGTCVRSLNVMSTMGGGCTSSGPGCQ